MPNKTVKDAYERIAQARVGSAVEASPEYLAKMHTLLLQWADETYAQLREHGRLEEVHSVFKARN